MSFRKIGLALAALGLTVTLAACSVPEEPAQSEVKLTKAEKTAIKKANKGELKEDPKDTETRESLAQQNARESAESYLDTGDFSREGLIDQLKFEGFSKADAIYAIAAIDPNFNKEAAGSAKSYLDTGSFSRASLLEQLEFEGFTTAQAEFGVAKAGY